jgi:hypothetical protein
VTPWPPVGAIVWFVHPDPAARLPPLGLFWNGIETLVLLGPTGTHLGGHTEKGEPYLCDKLAWVDRLGYVDAPSTWSSRSLASAVRLLHS